MLGKVQVHLFHGFTALFELAEFDAANLAADRLGQVVNKLDLARILVGRRDALDVLLQFERRARRCPECRALSRTNAFTIAPRSAIGTRDYRRFDHRRMLEQGALDLERPDAIAGRADHVVGASDEP